MTGVQTCALPISLIESFAFIVELSLVYAIINNMLTQAVLPTTIVCEECDETRVLDSPQEILDYLDWGWQEIVEDDYWVYYCPRCKAHIH